MGFGRNALAGAMIPYEGMSSVGRLKAATGDVVFLASRVAGAIESRYHQFGMVSKLIAPAGKPKSQHASSAYFCNYARWPRPRKGRRIGIREISAKSRLALHMHRSWRRDRDSNPGGSFPPTRVPGVRLRPLGHLS